MAYRGKTRSELQSEGWERSDFPILCETCLGDNPYIRMTKAEWDKECKVCARPFTVFRWKPGQKARFKKTEICQTCAKLKNVCQTCMLDLQYGLPVQLRDLALQEAAQRGFGDTAALASVSDVNRDFHLAQAEKGMANGSFDPLKQHQEQNEALLKLARNTPYYKRNEAHICSFFVKGKCTRGDTCPYRHEMPKDDAALKDNTFAERYYGRDDAVAKRMIRQLETQGPPLEPPDDKEITTLYLAGVTQSMTEQDIKDVFYHYGEVTNIHIIHKNNCAFIVYSTREAAEMAATKTYNQCYIKGLKMRVSWGMRQWTSQAPKAQTVSYPSSALAPSYDAGASKGASLTPTYDAPTTAAAPPAPPSAAASSKAKAAAHPYYPSMDPNAMGARPSFKAAGPPPPPSSKNKAGAGGPMRR